MTDSSRKSQFSNYLTAHIAKKDSGLTITNTRIGDKSSIAGGSYHIPQEEYQVFLKHYHDHVFLKNKVEYLTEKQLDEGCPILIDIDFRYDYSIKSRIHTSKHVIDVVCLYLEELKTMYQFEKNTKIPVYVFEKDCVNRVESKDITKDGIHIIIGLKSDRVCQAILRKRVLSKIGNIWGDLPIKNPNLWDDVFDEGITKGGTNWQLYGSKKPDNQPYKLSYIYSVCIDENDNELMYNPECVKTFITSENMIKLSARNTENVFLFLDNSFMDEYESCCDKQQQPRKFVSSSRTTVDGCMIQNVTNSEMLQSAISYFLESLKPDEFELREAYDYTMALPSSYYEQGSYTKWMRVGWALCNTDSRLFIVWVCLSAKQNLFDYKCIMDLWDKWKQFDSDNINGLSKRSIMYWVREDNPKAYVKVLENSIDYHIDQTLDKISMTAGDKGGMSRGSGDFDIATVLYHLYKDEYVCASVKGTIWYRYQNHKWTEDDSGTSLRKAISETLRDIYHKKAIRILVQSSQSGCDEDKTKILKKRVEIIGSICERLSKTVDKKNIMVEAKELFYDKEFLEKLDQNPYLLCFKNGIIDFKTNEFRAGRPEDFISKCTNINYIITTDKHSATIDEIKDFMRKLFPVEELHRYMWDHLASTLLGTCKEQTLNMYVGIGQNGKSVLVNLMEQVLGEYKGDVPLSLLTQQRVKIGGVSPELVQLKGVRYAVIQEPSKGDKINEGIMKQLTGGDPIQARSPYMTAIMTYLPQFKLVICSNEFMEITSTDHGTWRRVRVCDFEALFTEKPRHDDPQKPYQYLLDKDIKEKFKSWKEVFASLLVQQAFKTGGNVKDCTKVTASSSTYRESQDSIAEFISSRIMLNESSCLTKMVIAEQFRDWHAANYGGKAPNMKEISVQVDKKFGACRDGLWVGVQMKPINPFVNNVDDDIIVDTQST
jgi:P4 family phage/plasmid primase-like protien